MYSGADRRSESVSLIGDNNNWLVSLNYLRIEVIGVERIIIVDLSDSNGNKYNCSDLDFYINRRFVDIFYNNLDDDDDEGAEKDESLSTSTSTSPSLSSSSSWMKWREKVQDLRRKL